MPKDTIETKEVAIIRRKSGGLVVNANALVVDEDTVEKASEMLVFIKTAKKNLEDQRVFLVQPLNDHVKAINAKFKEWVQPLEAADSIVRSKVLIFRSEQKALRIAAEAVLIDDEETLSDLPQRIVRSSSGSTSVRKVWQYEVTDEAIVPRKYLMLDEGAIGFAVREGERDIPGIRIFQQESLSVRAKGER